MIVGLEIEVTDLQGKFKLSQNRSRDDRTCVIERLNESAGVAGIELAQFMAEHYASIRD